MVPFLGQTSYSNAFQGFKVKKVQGNYKPKQVHFIDFSLLLIATNTYRNIGHNLRIQAISGQPLQLILSIQNRTRIGLARMKRKICTSLKRTLPKGVQFQY